MTTLWQRDAEPTGNPGQVAQFLAGDDVRLDRVLLPFDIRATIAHVRGLAAIGLLVPEDAQALEDGLVALAREVETGTFVLDERFEDGHTAIEHMLTERLGPLGGRVHLGRSRNDQVMVALRLWMLAELDVVRSQTLAAAASCLRVARREADTVMPGYTHMQRAVPSSAGLWMGGFAESLLDDADLIAATRAWIDSSPLGTAAGYGVNLPLPRDQVAADLGFSGIQLNPMATQNSRGKYELQVVIACWQIMQTVRRLAWDLCLFTSGEFRLVGLPDALTTGSSIMPNKRNQDVVELLRTSAPRVFARAGELAGLLSLPSGYQRDLQQTKRSVMEAVGITADALGLLPLVIDGITVDRNRGQAMIDDAMYATDRAVDAAVRGVPFRDSYRAAMSVSDERSPAASLAARVSPGACGALELTRLEDRLAEARRDA